MKTDIETNLIYHFIFYNILQHRVVNRKLSPTILQYGMTNPAYLLMSATPQTTWCIEKEEDNYFASHKHTLT